MEPSQTDIIQPENRQSAAIHLSELTSLVSTEFDLSKQLLNTLSQERAAVLASDVAATQRLGTIKSDLANSLESTGQSRDQLLKRLGFGVGAQGIKDFLIESPSHALSKIWESLSEVALRCKEQNLLVGHAISQHLLVANQALQVLKTGSQTSEQLYAASGEVSHTTLTNTLAKI